ncbi:hypothetical protein BV22DRAFT_1200326 [Leucogyrophana mollusca]|uniref:Uncharacterized protein n=1 Tax=Leucogyrophana mollusca TaxID=85980 RepID=A0ACB8AV59_9AGAM|nr:hypothetical protein BV22DRAFT_1200326 [Leucogyrophana mollusca]
MHLGSARYMELGSKHLINGSLGSTNKSGLRTADLGRIRRRPAVLVRISLARLAATQPSLRGRAIHRPCCSPRVLDRPAVLNALSSALEAGVSTIFIGLGEDPWVLAVRAPVLYGLDKRVCVVDDLQLGHVR